MHFVNWTNQLAIHQSALMRGLVELGWQATMVVAEDVSPERRATGWYVPNFGGVNIITNPNKEAIARLLREDSEHTIHTFGAALGYPWGRYALWQAARMRCRLGFMMESADPDGWKGPLRWIKYSGYRVLLGKRLHFILAMGNLGVRWFRKCGYPANRLFPFGYVVEQSEKVDSSNPINQSFQIVYLGQLIPRKQVDYLLFAFSRAHSGQAYLSIIGDGPEKPYLIQLALKLGVSERINWHGVLPNQEVRKIMSQSDLLVLPSRFDGWGAVINEALMAGIPVICTDYCGSSDLLRDQWRGEVVPRNDIDSLAMALKRRIDDGPVTPTVRNRIKTWAKCLEGDSIAAYLISIIKHVYFKGPRPLPPWHKS